MKQTKKNKLEEYFKYSNYRVNKKILLIKFPMSEAYLYKILRELIKTNKIKKVKGTTIKYWEKWEN